MLVYQAYRYELQPTANQLRTLANHAGTARFAWNWGLRRSQEIYRATERHPSAFDLHRELCRLKKGKLAWMYEVSKCAPEAALRNLDRAYRNAFRRLKKGQRPGFPRFKRKGQCRDSFRIASSGCPSICDRRKIRLPKIGRVRTKEPTTKFKGRILGVTVSREADRWYASFCVERERPNPPAREGKALGVDLGLSCFAVTSEGEKVEAPRPLRKLLKLLRRRSQQHSRKRKGSNGRRRSATRLARLHARIKHQRTDFLHKLTTRLAIAKPVVVVEDLCVKGIVQGGMARAVADSGWGEFRRQLEYKCRWSGSRLVMADRFFPSTKTCSACGHVVDEMPLKQRTFRCPACGAEMDRDLNAARNLAALATGSSPGSDAGGEGGSGVGPAADAKPRLVEARIGRRRICA